MDGPWTRLRRESSEGSKGSEGKVLRIDRPTAGGFLSLTPFQAEGGGLPLRGNAYKVSVTDLLSVSYDMISTTVISHLRWLFPLWCLTAPPSPRGIGRATKGKRLYGQARRLTSPDLHILCRMCTVDNKALKGSLFICDSTVSTGYSAPACGGKVVAPATKGGCISDARRAVV